MSNPPRSASAYAAQLTACAGTWLEQPAGPEEQTRIAAARRALSAHRAQADAFAADPEEAARFSLELFRDPRFAPLLFSDATVEALLRDRGEPPVDEDPASDTFSTYLREAAVSLATARARRTLVEQVQRFIPQFVEQGDIRAALAIEYNIYLTSYGDGASPLIVQLLLGALTRWYEEHEIEE
ncbi:MAG TPA: hypothetical protein VFS21_18010 [Roseiflexaceae bacterium]|nr:hypothetical protein [Roseiflexaceae bacterium]